MNITELVNTSADIAFRVADVLRGGESTIPVPVALEIAASLVTKTLCSDFIPQIPYVDLSDRKLGRAIIATILPPLLWNIIGPLEYYTQIVSKFTLKPIIGVYLSGFIIASLSIYRSALFIEAINSQPQMEDLDSPIFHAIGSFIMVWGLAMFLGAYYRLGMTGTYLGDYFGILQEKRITAFPFNFLNNPMYDGSSMNHLAEAILYVNISSNTHGIQTSRRPLTAIHSISFLAICKTQQHDSMKSPAGVLLAFWLYICYRLGCVFEE